MFDIIADVVAWFVQKGLEWREIMEVISWMFHEEVEVVLSLKNGGKECIMKVEVQQTQ